MPIRHGDEHWLLLIVFGSGLHVRINQRRPSQFHDYEGVTIMIMVLALRPWEPEVRVPCTQSNRQPDMCPKATNKLSFPAIKMASDCRPGQWLNAKSTLRVVSLPYSKFDNELNHPRLSHIVSSINSGYKVCGQPTPIVGRNPGYLYM